MDRTALHWMTVMGSSVFSWGLALFIASEAIALPSASSTVAEEEIRVEETAETVGLGGTGAQWAARETADQQETNWTSSVLFSSTKVEAFEPVFAEFETIYISHVNAAPLVRQAVPAITPVTPQNVTPQADPNGDVFPESSPEPEAQGESEDVVNPNSSVDADVMEPEPTGDSGIESDSTDIESADTETTLEDSMAVEETLEDALEEDGSIETSTTEADVQTVDETIEAENNEAQAEEETAESNRDAETEPTDTAEVDGEADDTATEDSEETADNGDDDDELTAEELERQQLLIEGDRLFLEGKFAEAEELYRQAKDPFHEEGTFERADGFSDPEQLSPAGAVYWREYQAGLESGLETRIRIPLELLREKQPEFIPGHVAHAQWLINQDELDEAIQVLEQATALYPDDPGLAMTRVETLVADEQWLQAAIASRQFALLEPDHPDSETFNAQADEYQDRFRRKMRRRLTRTAIGNAIAGAVGFAVTGSWFGPLSAIETSILMIRGESAVGERVANNALDELDMVEDEMVLDYVNEIGQELAELGGRTEFDYEFYVVAEDELNAFALPGGKIFINAGAITRTDTGAELAGLIAHELAHAILSHGFQQVTRGNLTANVLQFVPYGGLATNLTVLRYSRDMERQADRLGTRLLATSPYAADGVRNLMQTLLEESENRSRFDWLSTHPNTSERVRNMERLIEQNGYNRYAFEDIERHLQIRERVEEILIEMEKIDLDLEEEEETASEEDRESNPSNEDL